MPASRRHILVIEENRAVAGAIVGWFENLHDFALHIAVSVRESLGLVGRQAVDLAIVDLTQALEVSQRLAAVLSWRNSGLEFPIIATSANDYDGLLVDSFKAGVDDFLRKPYLLEELHLRVQRQLARGRQLKPPEPRIDGVLLPRYSFTFAGATVTPDLRINFENRTSFRISAKQLGILRELSDHTGSLLLRDNLIYAVWGADANTNSSSVHQYLHVLRKLFRSGGVDLNEFVVPESKVGWRVLAKPTALAINPSP